MENEFVRCEEGATLLRHEYQHDGLMLSYLDAGGGGQPLVALHAHWMEGQTFAPLAAALAPEWRIIALDQRGHGHSEHAASYTRENYLGDLDSLFTHIGLGEAVLLGNSLGGVNAYQFAARHPERVRALVIEDIGVEIADDTSFALAWGGVFKTRGDLVNCVGPRFLPYLQDSIRQVAGGWRLAFDPTDMVASQGFLNGDHWQDWLASDCPALLIRGLNSRVTTQPHLEQMALRRRNTRLELLEGGHVVHMDNPAAFHEAVRRFLRDIPL
jgi:pimeloyl-ACP methyl ester carboxylesterase